MKENRRKPETVEMSPCLTCPYKFSGLQNTCTMVKNYPECVWGAYHKILAERKALEIKENKKKLLELAEIDPIAALLEAKRMITEAKLEQHRREQEVNRDEKHSMQGIGYFGDDTTTN